MKHSSILCIFASFVLIVYGCDPLVESNQSAYCRAPYVLTGIVRKSNVTAIESVFRVRVTSNIKGVIARIGSTITMYGSGLFDSCGTTQLDVNKKYLIYVYTRSESPGWFGIAFYYEATPANLNRVRNYDCSCKVEIDLPSQPFEGEPAPENDKCVITEKEFNCHFAEGYCARRRDGQYGRKICKWIANQSPCSDE